MRFAINLDNLTFIQTGNPAATLAGATMRRNDVLPIEVEFYRGGRIVELKSGATGSIKLNEKGTYGGAGLGSDSSFELSGSGVDAVYSFNLDLSGAAVDTAFDAEPAFILALLEVMITEGADVMRTEPLAVTLQNSINA